jgi:AraC-like DNA-binding protein
VRPAGSVAELLADPVDRYLTGRAFVAWVQGTSFVGASHFGAFEAADLPAIVELAALPFHPVLVPPYDVMHDLGGVGALDRRSFDILEQFLAARMPELSTRARKLAVVRPAGLAGAAFTGLFHDHSRPFDAQLFTDRGEALDWLGLYPHARREIDAILAPFIAAPPLLRQVRALIAADPRGATVETIAAAVAHSARSLQRHLSDHGTSFRDELIAARVAAAKTRLIETDDKIEVIARDLGFTSASAFTTMFTRITGAPPAAFRVRRDS